MENVNSFRNSLLQTRDNSRPASAGKADGKKRRFQKEEKVSSLLI